MIQQLLHLRDVHLKHQRELLSIALWKWTEAPGVPPHPKYNIRYCSEGVVQAVTSGQHVPINHEHVGTRKSLVDALLKKTWENTALEGYLDTHAQACIVTLAEHAALGQARGKGWNRYADAGVRVFDRKAGTFVDPQRDFQSTGAGADLRPLPEAPAGQGDTAVDEAIGSYAKAELIPLLRELASLSRQSGAATALHQASSGKPKYFRVHDAQIEEPTRAVAYANFNGNVDYALMASELPKDLRDHPAVSDLSAHQKTYTVRCTMASVNDTLVAREMLALALDKLRTSMSG